MDYNGFKTSVHPGLWCNWIINDDGNLEWNGAEKFYNYIEWLEYLIDNFFEPLDYELNGDITWQGEDSDDIGTIHVLCNIVRTEYGVHVYSVNDIQTEDMIKELEKRGYKVTA